MKRILLLILLLVLGFISYSQNGKWKKAQKVNTIESYQQFRKDYPRSEYSDEAQLKLIELELRKAKTENTIEGYKYFLEEYDDNIYRKDAENALIDLEFKNVNKQNTINAYENFLQKYPGAKFRIQVTKIIDSLSYAEARAVNTWGKYEEYINKFGKDALYFKAAGDNAEDLLYKEIISQPNISLCEHFMNAYPGSLHHNEISGLLSKIRVEKTKKDIELYFKEVTEFADNNNRVGAISSLDKIIALDSSNVRALMWRGYIRYFDKNYQGSIDDYLKALRHTDNDTTLIISYFNIAHSMLDLGNDVKALNKVNEMVRVKPKFSYSYYYRAYIKNKLNDESGAINDLSKAIQLDVKFLDAYAMRGELYSSMNNHNAAISDFKKVIDIDPKYDLPSEYVNKYKASIFTKKETYVGTIETINQLFSASITGVDPGGFEFWLKEYPNTGFDIDQKTALKWGLVTRDKNSSVKLNYSCKGWKVEFTTSNYIYGRGNDIEKGDYITKQVITYKRLY